MIFAAIPAGTRLFVDANVFVYAFGNDVQFGPACLELLKRIETTELAGLTSSHVLSDVAHRLMTLEALDTFGLPYSGIGRKLRDHPELIHQLKRYRLAVIDICAANVDVIAVTVKHVVRAVEISGQHRLLTNDALIASVMETSGLTLLASNDSDFDRVPNITRCTPV